MYMMFIEKVVSGRVGETINSIVLDRLPSQMRVFLKKVFVVKGMTFGLFDLERLRASCGQLFEENFPQITVFT